MRKDTEGARKAAIEEKLVTKDQIHFVQSHTHVYALRIGVSPVNLHKIKTNSQINALHTMVNIYSKQGHKTKADDLVDWAVTINRNYRMDALKAIVDYIDKIGKVVDFEKVVSLTINNHRWKLEKLQQILKKMGKIEPGKDIYNVIDAILEDIEERGSQEFDAVEVAGIEEQGAQEFGDAEAAQVLVSLRQTENTEQHCQDCVENPPNCTVMGEESPY